MEIRRLAILAVLALPGTATGEDSVRGADGRTRYLLAVQPVWEKGEGVTTSVSEERRRTSTITRKEGPPTAVVEEEKLTAEFVVRCDEVSPEGRFLRGTAHVTNWRRTETGSSPDTSAKGAVLALGDGAWKRVVGVAVLSEAARAWLDAAFPGGAPADHSAAERFAGVPALAVGEFLTAEPEALEKGSPPAARRFVPGRSSAKFTLVVADFTPQGRKVVVSDESHAEMRDEAAGGRTTETTKRSRFSGVLPLWHRTVEETTRRTTRTGAAIGSVGVRIEESAQRTRRSRPGGTIPEIPAPAPPTPPPAPPGGK